MISASVCFVQPQVAACFLVPRFTSNALGAAPCRKDTFLF